MTRRIATAFPLVALLISLVACASHRPAPSLPTYGDNAAAREKIQEVLDASWEALSVQDLAEFNQYVSDDWHLYTAMGNKLPSATLFDIHQANITNFRLTYTDLVVHVHGDVAWATYDATMSGLRQGEDWGGDFIFTQVFQRLNGEWIILHSHESRIQ